MNSIISRGLAGYQLIARGYAEAIIIFLIRMKAAGVSSSKSQQKRKKYIGVRAIFDLFRSNQNIGPIDGTQFVDFLENDVQPIVAAKPLGCIQRKSGADIIVYAEPLQKKERG